MIGLSIFVSGQIDDNAIRPIIMQTADAILPSFYERNVDEVKFVLRDYLCVSQF